MMVSRVFNKAMYVFSLALDPIERRYAMHRRPGDSAPIFIIGAPRSGSTVLYQVMARGLDVSYLTNAHCKLFGAPLFVERFRSSRVRLDDDSGYESTFGRTTSPDGPSECGNFWYRWFPRNPQYVTDVHQLRHPSVTLKCVVDNLAASMGQRLLFKNMPCALRLRVLGPLFPDARFIVIHRSLYWMAQSILEARLKLRGSYDAWWSMEPPGFRELQQLSPAQQVVEQVRSIYNIIDDDSRRIGHERFLHVSYEEFCANTHATLANIASFLDVDVARNVNIPRVLPMSTRERLPENLGASLREAVDGATSR